MDKVKGGLSDDMSKKDIADKFDITVDDVTKELEMGSDIEMEHVETKEVAKEIAMDHLVEIPDYYTRLKKMEKEAKEELNIEESSKGFIRRKIRESVELSIVDETPLTHTHAIYYKDRLVGQIEMGKINKSLPEDSMELLDVQIDKDYNPLVVIGETLTKLWSVHKNTNKFYLSPPQESRAFWSKMGAHRLNNDYFVISRGH
jgi:hypothetical protein